MATNINTIKNWFRTGLKPTQAQFWAFFESYWHKDETIPQSSISNLTNVLNAKLEKLEMQSHKADPNAHADLFLKARIIPYGQMQVFKVPSNENNDVMEVGDYCIGWVENSLVNGNWNGADPNLKSSYE